MLGTWIDGLTDEERDRIVEAQEWGFGWFAGRYGPESPCLMEHVCPDLSYRAIREAEWEVITRYDNLCDRFGLPRIVKACKQRAGHAPPTHEMSGRAERKGPGAWPVTANPGRKARA